MNYLDAFSLLYFSFSNLVAQSTSSSISDLEQQVKSLQTTNSVLSFATVFSVILGLAAVITAYRTVNSKVQEILEEEARRECKRQLSSLLENRLEPLEKAAEVEIFVRKSKINYWNPSQTSIPEKEILANRGFSNIETINGEFQDGFTDLNCDILVIHLIGIDSDKGSNLLDQVQQGLLDRAADPSNSQRKIAIVVYARPGYEALRKVRPEFKYFIPANSPISLVGNVVDAACLIFSFTK